MSQLELKQVKRMVTELREMGFSRYRIAKACNVSWPTIVLWENGSLKESPRVDNLLALKDFYNNPKTEYLK